MLKKLSDADIWEIDKILWLSSPAFKRNFEKHEMFYANAVLVGKETAISCAVKKTSIKSSLAKFNVKGVEYFTQESGDRAYYMPEEEKIYVNEYFLSEMAEYFKKLDILDFTFEIMLDALILHELFHHIEEIITKPTDALLGELYSTVVPQIYRDIAAFSFVNTIMQPTVCQLIDVFWIKKHRPNQFVLIEELLK